MNTSAASVTVTTTTSLEVEEYINHLSVIQLKALTIAKSHLGSSFNIMKSNGYIEWKKTQRPH